MTTEKHLTRDLQRLDENIARWHRRGMAALAAGDPALARQYAKDVEQLRAIRREVRRGDYSWARERIERLDTLVRDQIPRRLYNTIFAKGE